MLGEKKFFSLLLDYTVLWLRVNGACSNAYYYVLLLTTGLYGPLAARERRLLQCLLLLLSL
jgi:hypothetical protein